MIYFKDLCDYNGYPNATGSNEWTECSNLADGTEIEIPNSLAIQTEAGTTVIRLRKS